MKKLERKKQKILSVYIPPPNTNWFWKCSLCNMELPDDVLAELRKRRHANFHIDESIGTGKQKRNWTFGNAKFELVSKK